MKKDSLHERNASNFKIYQPIKLYFRFCVRRTDFSLLSVIFTLLNFFNSDKNIISKREKLETKESYVRQISNRIKTNSKTKIYIAK